MMVALANLYTILDVSIQQLAVGLAILALLVALAWYVKAEIRHTRPGVESGHGSQRLHLRFRQSRRPQAHARTPPPVRPNRRADRENQHRER